MTENSNNKFEKLPLWQAELMHRDLSDELLKREYTKIPIENNTDLELPKEIGITYKQSVDSYGIVKVVVAEHSPTRIKIEVLTTLSTATHVYTSKYNDSILDIIIKLLEIKQRW